MVNGNQVYQSNLNDKDTNLSSEDVLIIMSRTYTRIIKTKIKNENVPQKEKR